MALTPKQERFCQGVVSGMNQSAAYKHAYNCDSMAQPTIYAEASRLASNHKVTARIQELRWASAARAAWSKGRVLVELMKNLESAQQHNKFSAANQALRQIARLGGLP